MNVDVLIVGCGLAGSTLANRLIEAGNKVVIISDSSIKSATRVAAGVFNPIVFKRLNLSWKAEESLLESEKYYTGLEHKLKASFFHKLPMMRCHGSDDERNLWIEKRAQPEYQGFLGVSFSVDERPWLNQPFGGAEVLGTGFLDTEKYLDAVQDYFKEIACFLDEKFDHELLKIEVDTVVYKGITAKKLVFCEGSSAVKSPYFSVLPFVIAKGEIIKVEIPGIPNELFNGKIYGAPLGNQQFRVGATYSWNEENDDPSSEGKQEIVEKLRKLIHVPFSILEHQAGFRPSSHDRRPYLGMHPKFPNIGVFNGLGTKGVLLAPMLSLEMYDHLMHQKPITMESSIYRIKKDVFA
jgi:glycine oxidase